jgi:hypothetical protein
MGSYDPFNSDDEKRLTAVGLANRFCRVIPALLDISMRTAVLQNDLEEAGIHRAARALDVIAGRAEQAEPAALQVIAAAMPVLTNPQRQAWVEALRQTAKRDALLSLVRLLARRAKLGEETFDDHPELAVALPLEPGGRPLSLGERRALARKPSRATLDKLLSDPHPLVIQNLLVNPRLTEDDVVRMAARRPARREVIIEIARSPKWMTRGRVRLAVVLNPGTPPEIAVPVLPQLSRTELLDVETSTLLPIIVRSAARALLERRPPMSSDPEGEPPRQ